MLVGQWVNLHLVTGQGLFLLHLLLRGNSIEQSSEENGRREAVACVFRAATAYISLTVLSTQQTMKLLQQNCIYVYVSDNHQFQQVIKLTIALWKK